MQVSRASRGTTRVAGYLVAAGRRWIGLSVFDDGALSGFTAVRLDDIRRVQRDGSAQTALDDSSAPPPPRTR